VPPKGNRLQSPIMREFHVIIQATEPPWGVTFEEAYAALEQISGIFLEPDGSFFRASRPGGEKWQVEGNLYDQGPNLAYVDMKGSCPVECLDELLRPLGWPSVRLTIQMVREGTQVSDTEFRELAKRT
jgi:hypothetical protein